ncbi:hypothetical protein [Caballeronia cordobensis]|uniref:Uncharacterized protein n=1 Tax=Caballeronia cordobensis TaxID=1353886 RepID=A0A158GDZ1_CABCO|nr:hypothetical protein [Caballeronia cordobensis]AET93587.1 hypothetical protein BYI23_D000770 [Burkholderia sp. YI23]AQH03886.1 hypothetical protein A9R05_33395 [Burkholderia sp. KK1]BAO91436.1 uncharacterized protein BRPE67_DCDS02810 [Burkholderia sp. RPE67]SAL30348.1 hypothetical protein AWB70_01871 [Caballeronia cordobensis]
MSELNSEIGTTENVRAADHALLGEGAVLVWNDVVSAGREQFYEWHDKEHIPERLAIPGFRRGRRYVRPGHSPEWLTMYEAADLDVVVSPAYLERLNTPTPATVDTLRYFRNTSRAVCRIVHSVGSSSGGHVLALRLDVPAQQAEAMKAYLCAEAFPRAAALTSVVACHLYMADQSGSHIDTAESSTRAFDVPAWVVLIETTTPQAAESARELLDTQKLASLGAKVRADGTTYSMEICRLATATAAL